VEFTARLVAPERGAGSSGLDKQQTQFVGQDARTGGVLRLDEAEVLLRRALAIDETSPSSQHPR
jgi:hypothetical protein